MKRNFRSGSLVMPLLLITIFASAAHAQMTQSNSNMHYKSSNLQVGPTTERTVIVAVRHIAQARSDIHRKDLAQARHEVTEAARLIGSIRDNLSTATTKNLILIARRHLEYEQAQQVLHDLPPIYTSLETISVYLPTDKAKTFINRAKGYLENNDKRKAEKELALAEKSLVIVEVELPIFKVQQYLTKAQEHLAAGNTTKADKALQVAERRAMALYTGVNSPLFLAKQILWQAFREYAAAKLAEVGPYLEKARNHLNEAAAKGSGSGKEEAGKLSQEVAALEKKAAGKGKLAESELKAAWEKSDALAERSAAYLSAGLSEEETTLEGGSNLIEAKLHVEYAETYQVTMAEPDKATKELDKAYSYLQKAVGSNLTGSADRMRIQGIGSIIQALKANSENKAAVKERYDTIKEELSGLIQRM